MLPAAHGEGPSYVSEFGAPNFRRVGETAIVLEFAEPGATSQQRLWGLARIARTWPHVREAVAGAGNLTLMFDRYAIGYDAVRDRLEHAWRHAHDETPSAHTIEVPVRYDGEDLHAVAAACNLGVDEVIALHLAGAYVVAFVGFLPGFAYLDGLDARLRVSRRTQPRTRVPAGSVAIAGAQSGIYPFDSPGGWQIIGSTALRVFDPNREPVALLQPGDSVRFVAI
jgi:5-oxoprolinase (ATP-hydrolysing) subunit B